MARKRKVEPQAEIAIMPQGLAIEGFKAQAKSWHRSSMSLVASGAVCMIVGAYSATRKVDYETTVRMLREEVAETGIKQAQIYKYIGLSRALVAHLLLKFKIGGPLQDVLLAKTHDHAMQSLLDYMEKARVRSLDDLGILVGKYRRTEIESPGTVPEQPQQEGAPAPTRATAQAIGARIVQEPEVLNTLSATDLVGSFLRAGHKPSEVIEALIPHIETATECNKLIAKLTSKLKRLRRGLTVVGEKATA